jgi:HlyD family secretion protein
MAGNSAVPVVHNIRTLYEFGTASGLSDRELLRQFMTRRDAAGEAAFETLVLRHGPTVLRVCRNVLREPADVDDAFQATFLVLVKRCRSMGQIESVAGWLYGVACRVAAHARVESARRRVGEARAALRVVEAVEAHDVDDIEKTEFGPIVQEEVRRLPAKYRAVVVLCYGEGMTHEQAAIQLDCPLGTVRSRMARARTLLQRRLSRRGLAPLPGISAAGLGNTAAPEFPEIIPLAPVPSELIHATVRAATRVAGGNTVAHAVSSIAASLVHHILWSTPMFTIKTAAATIALLGIVGTGVWYSGSSAQGPAVQRKADQPAHSPNEKAKSPHVVMVKSMVKAPTTVIMVVADGSEVKKGQVVCELDAAALEDQLVNQQIATRVAAANFENAKLSREEAEIDKKWYVEGIYLTELQETEGDARIAESEFSLAQDELNAVKAANPDNKLGIKRAELATLRARFGLEKAQWRRRLLVDYTNPKKNKEFTTAVEKARSQELAKQAAWALEDSKEKKLERQIAQCTIVAPIDGKLVYASELLRQPAVSGAIVRRDTPLFEIRTTAQSKTDAR